MGCLEKRFNIKVAVILPSVLFALLHIIGRKLDFMSILQLILAGSAVGILFSLITYESGSVWNSATVHSIWNMAIIGGVLYIGSEQKANSIFNFILNSKSFLLLGGDFGIEASLISIATYFIFILIAAILITKK